MATAYNPNYDIYLATKAGDIERVKYLVEVEDVNINRMDDHNSVPLFYACLCGHTGNLTIPIDNKLILSEKLITEYISLH